MDDITANKVTGDIEGLITTDDTGIGAHLVPGKVNQALHIDRAAYVTYHGTENTCMHNPEMCSQGITFTMWLFLFKGMT